MTTHDYDVYRHTDFAAISCPGQLGVGNRQAFKQQALEILASGPPFLAVDFADTGYIDSSGLGVLVSLSKRIREAGGSLACLNLNEDLLALFESLAFDKLFELKTLPRNRWEFSRIFGSAPPRIRAHVGGPAQREGPPPATPVRQATKPFAKFDVFISHASEDKETVARPLYQALAKKGVKVWFDESELTLGDSLGRKIDQGLAHCRFGVVILSQTFFAKEWPRRELDGLVARETTSGEKAILPIWHEMDATLVTRYSPALGDRLAVRTEEGVDEIVAQVLRALG